MPIFNHWLDLGKLKQVLWRFQIPLPVLGFGTTDVCIHFFTIHNASRRLMIIYYWKKFNDSRGILFDLYPGVLNKVLYEEAPPMYSIFDRKGTPIAGIHIPSSDKWYSFHEPFIERCIPFNCCKWTVFKIWINHKTRMFFTTISQPKKKTSVSPFGFFYRSKWQISLPFHILQQVKSRHLHIPEAWNRSPFRTEPPLMGNYREYPRGPLCQCVTGTPSWPNCF